MEEEKKNFIFDLTFLFAFCMKLFFVSKILNQKEREWREREREREERDGVDREKDSSALRMS